MEIQQAQICFDDLPSSIGEFQKDGYSSTEAEEEGEQNASTSFSSIDDGSGNVKDDANRNTNATNDNGAGAVGPSSGVAPWKDTSQFLGREAELEQLKALKDKVIGEHQSDATTNPPHPQEPSTDEEDNKAKPEPASTPKATKKLDVHPAVLVWGVSGTGKSALVDHFLETCCICGKGSNQKQKQSNEQAATAPSCSCCYVLRGKYDEYTGKSDPFSAIVQAIQDFTSQLKNGPKEELDRMRECVRAAFPSGGLRPMVKVVPSLSILTSKSARGGASVMGQSVSQRDNYSISMNGSTAIGDGSSPEAGGAMTEKTWNQLQYIFVQFIKAVSTKERPIYMFLDDLQWSAEVGLSLIARLVADFGLQNFLLLGAIRQDTNPHTDEPLDLTPDHPLARCLVTPLSSEEGEDGTHKAGGPDDASVVTSTTSMSQARKRRPPRTLQQITITNLALDDMTAWLSSMLDCNDIEDLSEKLHAKTDGNVFFTLQALEELERKDILAFNSISHRWEWSLSNPGDDDDSNAGSAQLPISDNIIGIIESKLRDLPMQLQQVLSIAAYIRSMFDISVLHRVLESERKHVDGEIDSMARISSKQELSSMLDHAVLERLISNPIGGTKYHFAHDRIQQAAQCMIPAGEARDKLRVRIGHCLLQMYRRMQTRLQEDEEEEHDNDANHGTDHEPKKQRKNHPQGKVAMPSQSTDSVTSTETFTSAVTTSEVDDGLLFVAADHLNTVQTKDHMFSVIMNLEVGEKATEMAALEAAAGYLRMAHEALQRVRTGSSPNTSSKTKGSTGTQAAASPSIWDSDEHYDICLRVYRARADVELSIGNYEVGYKLCDEVLERARSPDDKALTHFSMARALTRQDRHRDCMEMELRLLQSLKAFPSRWYSLHTMMTRMKVKHFLKNNTNEKILARSWMTDKKKLTAMMIRADFNMCSNAINKVDFNILNTCKMLCTSIKHGICAEMAGAFGTYGLRLCGTKEQALAQRCMKIGDLILEQVDGRHLEGMFRLTSASYVNGFRSTFEDALRDHKKGYHRSMEVGEFGIGILNYQNCVMQGLMHGLELKSVHKANEGALNQLDNFKLRAFEGMSENYRVTFRVMLKEDPIDWDEIEALSRRDPTVEKFDPSNALKDCMMFYSRGYLALFHRRYAMADPLFSNFVFLAMGDPSSLVALTETYTLGVINAERYRETGNQQHLTILRKKTKKLKKMTKARGRAWIHLVLILEAEDLAVTMKNKRHSRIQHAYNIAILAAIRAGCIQDAAMVNELAGEHYLQCGSKDMVGDYFVHAVDYYKAWGCKIKVDDVMQRRKKFLKHVNDPNRKHPEGLTDDGKGNYLFGITRDTFTGAITTRGAGLEAFIDAEDGPEQGAGVLVFGSELGDGVEGSVGLDEDELSVLTDIA